MFHLTSPAATRAPRARRVRLFALLAVLGPALVSGFADNDAGGITTYSLAGIQFVRPDRVAHRRVRARPESAG